MGKYQKAQREFLSTPHGALGTQRVNQGRCSYNKHLFQLHTVHQEPLRGRFEMIPVDLSFNSTRCIRNKDIKEFRFPLYSLSTPHGALGTDVEFPWRQGLHSFQLHTVHQEHEEGFSFQFACQLCFQLHTVHQEQVFPALLLRHIIFLSTPHGALGTEESPILD